MYFVQSGGKLVLRKTRKTTLVACLLHHYEWKVASFVPKKGFARELLIRESRICEYLANFTELFSLCALTLFNTRVSQFELNYWNKWTFPPHSNSLRCTCRCSDSIRSISKSLSDQSPVVLVQWNADGVRARLAGDISLSCTSGDKNVNK